MTRLAKPKTVAILSFDSNLSLYLDSLRYISARLQINSDHVVRIGCDGVLNACVSLNARKFEIKDESIKKKYCEICQVNQSSLWAKSNLNINKLDAQIDDNALNFIKSIEQQLHSYKNLGAIAHAKYKNLDVCAIALFDYLITNKINVETVLSQEMIENFLNALKDLLVIINFLDRINIEKIASHVVYVNGNYSQNTLVRTYLNGTSVRCLSLEPQFSSNGILNRVAIVPRRLPISQQALETEAIGEAVIKIGDARAILRNFRERIFGNQFNAYTSFNLANIKREEIKSVLKFFKKHERIHSFMLSSEDELVPHQVTHGVQKEMKFNAVERFDSQFEFTQHLLSNANKYPTIGFVIRLHPRMARNKRDSFESYEHKRYKVLFSKTKIPDNVYIITGDSQLSSYFIMSRSKMVIVSWSTIGLEAMLLKIPVVAIFPSYLMYPLTELTSQPSNFSELEAAVFDYSDFGKAEYKKFFAWLCYAHHGSFFSTFAPRSTNGIFGKIYTRLHNKLKKNLKLYLFMTRILRIMNNIVSSDVVLYRASRSTYLGKIETFISLMLLKRYQRRAILLFDRYEKELNIFTDKV